ncbi:ketoacyl-ACP synthase III [Desulfovibrio sp. ZJ369]|uniref:ketoacyl-ACP synthase III n=1 Tax=Desulfovibrio sp. ZJ369 TaxID=2709793 RepID=UPI0013E9A0EA|nr:ketoacyl-ACP synthase III [Desulfovibrio sp. ZJ369]
MFTTLQNVRIASLRSAVPTNEISLEDEIEYYGGSLKKISRLRTLLGMDRRRVCPPDVTASDLCAHAAFALLEALPDSRDTIDALIFVSQMPDWHQPATACELQHRLGLGQHCAAFDVNQGCAGYVYGLWLGSSLVASGAARQVLVLVGDAHPSGRDIRNRITTPVFGDAGSATLLVRDETASPVHFGIGTDGSGFETIIVPAGKARIPFLREHCENESLVRDIADQYGNIWQIADTYMDGGAVYDFTMNVVPDHICRLMQYSKINHDNIDWLILHQANKQIIENIALKSGFPSNKAPFQSFSKYGNTASASIPLALCDTFYEKQSPGTILLCGYGIGLSWASCLCKIDSWNCARPLEYEPDPDRPTRLQRIERWERIIKGEQNRYD